WALAQNSMDNLINIIQAESTLKRVSLRLFSRVLVKGDPNKDNEGWALAQNSMDNLINIIQAESTLKRVSLRLFSRV
ncbi:hypothetical protein E7X23_26520, partial [Bacteroides fragilis]